MRWRSCEGQKHSALAMVIAITLYLGQIFSLLMLRESQHSGLKPQEVWVGKAFIPELKLGAIQM